MSKKIALVLSGGGAKGAFQIGALKYIREEIMPQYEDFNFSIIAGVSVGSLNGVMLAQNKFKELVQLWNRLSNKEIYRGRINVASFAWRMIRGKKSLLSYAPLQEKIEKHIQLKDLDKNIDFRAGAVSLLTGEYYYFKPEQFSSNREFQKAILASALMPIIWEPVDHISSSAGTFKDMVDGGIRNNSPLRDVLEFMPDEVVIINCSPFRKSLETDPEAAKSLFQIAKRSMVEIAMNEIFLGDLKKYLKVNQLVIQAKEKGVELTNTNGRAYHCYKTILINPEESLGDVLNFEQLAVQPRMELGYRAAQKAFANYRSEAREDLYTNL